MKQAIKKAFPFSFGPIDVKALVITLIVYAIVGAIGGFLIGVLSHLWLIGWIFSIIGGLLDIYVTVGIILVILYTTKIID